MKEIEPGSVFGQWTVIAPSKDRRYYYVCRCSCGTVKEVYYTSLLNGKTKSCPKCAAARSIGRQAPTVSDANFKKAQEKYLCKTINGFYIKEVLKENKNHSNYECVTVCPKCGREFATKIIRLKLISSCPKCSRDIDKKNKVTANVTKTNGSDLAVVSARINGATNKNSTSGINGVSLMKNGKYRAYINFQHKQIYLGSFDDIEDAKDARKEAEKAIFGKFLDDNAGWEQRLSDAMKEYKQKKT